MCSFSAEYGHFRSYPCNRAFACHKPLHTEHIQIPQKNSFHIVRARHEGRTFGGILSIGVQSLITELSSGIVVLAFNIIILGLAGNTGVAAYAVIANTSIVAVSIFTGIAQGGQPLISAAHGIGDKDRLRAVLRYSIISQLVIALMVYLAIAFFTTPIAAIFNSEHIDSLQRMAEDGMKIYFTGLFFSGFNIIISAFFAASEKSYQPRPSPY